MDRFLLPYGRSNLELEISGNRINGKLVSEVDNYFIEKSEEEIIEEALADPIGSAPLHQLAQNKEKVVLITSDHTRPVPSRLTIPLMLKELRRGNSDVEITILVATGFHRATTEAEMRDKFGDRIVDEENVVVHNSRDQSQMISLGSLPSGGELIINQLALEADLLVADGFIEPHFFAGFSGGRKSVLPGIASKTTVLANHCSEFIDHPRARTGILEGNPLHKDMVYAARKVGLEFILNVVINSDKKVIKVFAGDMEKAHHRGCDFVNDLAGVKCCPAEIVITTNGGYPLDQNIYQAVKGMTAAEASTLQNGVIIMVAECSHGHGGEDFYNTFAQANSIREIMSQIMARERQETIPDQWESQILTRILLNYEVIMVTDAPRQMVEDMFMHWAPDLSSALLMAEGMVDSKDPDITVIPDGVSVIVQSV